MPHEEWKFSDNDICPKCGKKNFCTDHQYMNSSWWEEYQKTFVSWRRVDEDK